MPARSFPAEALSAAYQRRMSRPASQRPAWRALATSVVGLDGATGAEVRQAVTAWAAANGLPDPCNRGRNNRPAEATGLTFGIEIEFRRPMVNGDYIDPEVIAAALREAGVDTQVEGYNHRTRSFWKLIHDGSSDRELVSPILRGEDGLRQVRAAMRVLRGFGCEVGASEGMHVHIGAGHLDSHAVARIVEGYYRNRNRFDSVVARGRRAGTLNTIYCAPLTAAQVRNVNRQADAGHSPQHLSLGGRYFTVNLQALSAHGTIEFRQHQGTLNGTKATAWVRLLLGFFETAATGMVPEYGTVREMAEAFGVPAPSVEFLARRAGEAEMAVAS